jgi:hypothetical protein
MKKRLTLSITIILSLVAGLLTTGMAFAQEPESVLKISLDYSVDCGEGAADVEFTVSWEPAEADFYLFFMDFGDGETTEIFKTEDSTLILPHTYIDQGDYEIFIMVGEIVTVGDLETSGLSGELTQTLTLEGPEIDNFFSAPGPPVIVYGENGEVTFTAVTVGGTLPYTYEWDLGGGETTGKSTSETANANYTEIGKYKVKTTVTDGCGFTDSASMSVVVADPEDACHPTAQKIAEAVGSLFPDQAGEEYTCEDIYTMFDNPSGENNLGFGRMWMAYKLAESIDLGWEEILAWKMDQSGWGSLLQLNKFAEVLSDQGIGDLMALVMSEDYTLADVRAAVRSVTRFEADFDDALARIADGASPGELSQFYSLASALGTDYETLDGYLADGMTLSEIKHAANFAERMEVDWTEIADFRTEFGESWGAMKQAFSLATDEFSAADILAMGIQEFRKEERTKEQMLRIAEKLGNQFGIDPETVQGLFEGGECEGSWACVRKTLREQSEEGLTDRDYKLAAQIGAKYGGYGEAAVLAVYQGEECALNWGCTRAYFRNTYMETKTKGKPVGAGKQN